MQIRPGDTRGATTSGPAGSNNKARCQDRAHTRIDGRGVEEPDDHGRGVAEVADEAQVPARPALDANSGRMELAVIFVTGGIVCSEAAVPDPRVTPPSKDGRH